MATVPTPDNSHAYRTSFVFWDILQSWVGILNLLFINPYCLISCFITNFFPLHLFLCKKEKVQNGKFSTSHDLVVDLESLRNAFLKYKPLELITLSKVSHLLCVCIDPNVQTSSYEDNLVKSCTALLVTPKISTGRKINMPFFIRLIFLLCYS